MISESLNNRPLRSNLSFIKITCSSAARRADSKLETLKQFRVNVQSSSATLAPHQTSIGLASQWLENEMP